MHSKLKQTHHRHIISNDLLDCWKKFGRSLSNSILKKEVNIICFGFIFCKVAFYEVQLLSADNNSATSLHVESIEDPGAPDPNNLIVEKR